MLRRLGPRDLASLAGVDRACAAVVAATALMQWARDEQNLVPPRRFTFVYPAPRLCLKGACSLATHGGHLEALEWLHDTGCPFAALTFGVAAEGGHLAVLKWLHNTRCPWDSWTCSAAAASGHLAVLK